MSHRTTRSRSSHPRRAIPALTPAPAPATARGPGRPRDAGCRAKVLRAAQRLLLEEKLSEFSVERVAREAGVSKATIYRWWPNKSAIAIEAFRDRLQAETTAPPSVTATEAFRRQLEGLARILRGELGQVVRQLVSAIQHDAKLAKLFHDEVVIPRRRVLREMFARGVRSGEFRNDLSLEAMIDMTFGTLYMRLLFQHLPITAELIDEAVRLLQARQA
ncbi:TetR/AcrR family transcriptional regulator [Roseiterribacter gracilis]|uniref:TetR family transcriptional regulator n=1 Tax=Roseiterribacter gracilis TaxID=2812848 RepID=A0A8S8XDM2_9PROT|nr:TetR family transcriptional regulator [Rhodospirillales bacterium TMPK1]